MGTPAASRELLVTAAAVVLAGRFVDGPIAWAVALGLAAGVAFGALQILAESGSPAAAAGVPIEALMVPAAAAFASFGAIRLVPVGILLVPAIAAAVWLMARVLASESRTLAAARGPSAADRTAVLVGALVVAFLGFTAVAGLVPGGLPEPGASLGPAPTGADLALLAGADAVIAFGLGYRGAALRTSNLRDVAWFGLTSAVVVAIAAVGLRAMEIPRLLGPALLVLVLFLWDAVHGAAPTRRRDPQRIWEAVLLIILGIVVVAWSLRLRS